uniref:beta strand repeat-containing protein n=1 Tax=Victivallis vadensis TaxID=172901 RepID=UPI00307E91FD
MGTTIYAFATQEALEAARNADSSLNDTNSFVGIQTAIDAAAEGDSVQPAAGDYPESLTVKSGVTLLGVQSGKLTGLLGIEIQEGAGLLGSQTLGDDSAVTINGSYQGGMELGSGMHALAIGKNAVLGGPVGRTLFLSNQGTAHFTEFGGTVNLSGSSVQAGPLSVFEMNGGRNVIDLFSANVTIDTTGNIYFSAGFICNASVSPALEIGAFSGSMKIAGDAAAYGFFVGNDGAAIASYPSGTVELSISSFTGNLNVESTENAAYALSVYSREISLLSISSGSETALISVSGVNNAYALRNISVGSSAGSRADVTISSFSGDIRAHVTGAESPARQQSVFGIYNYSATAGGTILLEDFSGTIAATGSGIFRKSTSGSSPMLVGIYNNGTTALNDFSGTLLVNQAVSGSSAIGSTIGIYGPDITLDNFTGTIYAGRYLDDDLELRLAEMRDPAKRQEVYNNLASSAASGYAVYGTAGGANGLTFNDGAVIFGNIRFAEGADAITVNGADTLISGQISLGAGNDQFTVTGGQVIGNVFGGDGDDRFTITGGEVNGWISGDGGTDTLTFGSASAGYFGSLYGIQTIENIVFNGGSSVLFTGASATNFADGAISINVTESQLGAGSVYTVISGKLAYGNTSFAVNGATVFDGGAVKIGGQYRLLEAADSAITLTEISGVIDSTEKLLVNSGWADKKAGQPVQIGDNYYIIGVNAFGTISDAIRKAPSASTLQIAGGAFDSFQYTGNCLLELSAGAGVTGSVTLGGLGTDSTSRVNVAGNITGISGEYNSSGLILLGKSAVADFSGGISNVRHGIYANQVENVTINTLGGSIVTSDSAYSYGVYLRYVKNAELKEISGTISASNNGESDEGVGITQEKATDGTLKIGTLTNTAKVSGYSASGFAVGIAHTAASSAATEIGTLAGTVEAKGQYGSTGLLNAATGSGSVSTFHIGELSGTVYAEHFYENPSNSYNNDSDFKAAGIQSSAPSTGTATLTIDNLSGIVAVNSFDSKDTDGKSKAYGLTASTSVNAAISGIVFAGSCKNGDLLRQLEKIQQGTATADTVTGNATGYAIVGGKGDDVITLNAGAKVFGMIALNSGNDILNIAAQAEIFGSVDGDILTLTNNGVISGDVSGQTLTISGTGSISGAVYGGAILGTGALELDTVSITVSGNTVAGGIYAGAYAVAGSAAHVKNAFITVNGTDNIIHASGSGANSTTDNVTITIGNTFGGKILADDGQAAVVTLKSGSQFNGTMQFDANDTLVVELGAVLGNSIDLNGGKLKIVVPASGVRLRAAVANLADILTMISGAGSLEFQGTAVIDGSDLTDAEKIQLETNLSSVIRISAAAGSTVVFDADATAKLAGLTEITGEGTVKLVVPPANDLTVADSATLKIGDGLSVTNGAVQVTDGKLTVSANDGGSVTITELPEGIDSIEIASGTKGEVVVDPSVSDSVTVPSDVAVKIAVNWPADFFGADAPASAEQLVPAADRATFGTGNDAVVNFTSDYTLYGTAAQASDADAKTWLYVQNSTIRNGVFGGSLAGRVGTSNIYVQDSSISAVYGGGQSFQALDGTFTGSTTGTANVYVSGGEIGEVFGGADGVGSTVGAANVMIAGGTVRSVYGGGVNGASTATSNVTITGNADVTTAYAGGLSSDVENATLTVSGPDVQVYKVYGGGSLASTVCNSELKIENGATVNYVYGGGDSNGHNVTGSMNVTVSDSTVSNVLYGIGRSCLSCDGTVNVTNSDIAMFYVGTYSKD